MAADIGTTLVSWSSTSGSNQPAGTTSVSGNLDDNIRELQGVVVRGLSYKGADIASATTTDLGAIEGLMHDITGAVTITSFGTVRAGIWKIIKFEAALLLTHSSVSLILPGGANITTADGDIAIVVSEGSGNWRCASYVKASGLPVKQSTQPTRQVFASGSGATYTTPVGATRINIRMIGGGGGGGGATGNNGTAGNNTTFSTFTASGGAAGIATGGAGGAGGAASGGDINISGGGGTGGGISNTAGVGPQGGGGGNSYFGGGGSGGASGAAGQNGATNSGGGGGGGAGGSSTNSGGGGGAGGYVEKLIIAPATTYVYTVGAAANGGAAGGFAGGNGAAGLIIVDEMYD